MKDTIFVSIASYRDKLCIDTVNNIYENAKYPDNIYIGICQQNKEDEDDDCLENINNPRIKITRISYKDAKGPVYARYLCSKLYDNQDYFLQIDSHTKFVKNWDIKCIFAIKSLKKKLVSNKPVLSHYPRNFQDNENYNNKERFKVTYIKKAFVRNDNMISFAGAQFKDTENSFIRTPFVTGGFIFAEVSFLKDVP